MDNVGIRVEWGEPVIGPPPDFVPGIHISAGIVITQCQGNLLVAFDVGDRAGQSIWVLGTDAIPTLL